MVPVIVVGKLRNFLFQMINFVVFLLTVNSRFTLGRLDLLVLFRSWLELKGVMTKLVLVLFYDRGNLGFIAFPDFINVRLSCF